MLGTPRSLRRGLLRTVGIALGALLVLAGGIFIGKVATFEWDYHKDGHQLLANEHTLIERTHASPVACAKQLGDGPVLTMGRVQTMGSLQVFGDLLAPSIHLTAPVVEGTSDAQLDVAVGHDPSSAWPASPGTVVLSAHDVSWFSHIGQLKRGSTLEFVSPCVSYTYRITRTAVVTAGSPIYSGVQSRLVLTSCYPFTALYLTPNRYVVEADLVEVVNIATPPPDIATNFPVPALPIPPDLAATGLTLATNDLPLGSLSYLGAPSPAWEQSQTPLQVHEQLLNLYFAALHAAEETNQAWWHAIAPTVPFYATAQLWGASVRGYLGQADALLWVNGTTVGSLAIEDSPILSGGGYRPNNDSNFQSGHRNVLSFGVGVKNGVMYISHFSITH